MSNKGLSVCVTMENCTIWSDVGMTMSSSKPCLIAVLLVGWQLGNGRSGSGRIATATTKFCLERWYVWAARKSVNLHLPSWQKKKKLSLLRKKGSTEYLCLLAEEDNNTSVVSPESEILGTKSYLFIHKWKVIPFAAEVYFPCGRLKLWKGRAAAAGGRKGVWLTLCWS